MVKRWFYHFFDDLCLLLLFVIMSAKEGVILIQYTSIHVEMLEILLKTILCDYGGKVLTNRLLYEKLETKVARLKVDGIYISPDKFFRS